MEKSNYNSLTEKLIQKGILKSQEKEDNIFENYYGINVNSDMSNSPFNNDSALLDKPQEENIEQDIKENIKNKKRINQYDLDMIKNSTGDEAINKVYNFRVEASMKILNRFLNFKKNKLNKSFPSGVEEFLFKFFPNLYSAKITKDAMKKLLELDIDAKTLLDKSVPYGEYDKRYKDLIKYLSYANQIQKELKNKV